MPEKTATTVGVFESRVRPVCPVDIELLLHCHYKLKAHPDIRAAAFQRAVTRLLKRKAIAPVAGSADIYRTTERGENWVVAICNVKCPEA